MNEELIQRFFRKQCTPEEARIVLSYLNSNPELLNVYLDKSEWDEIESAHSVPGEFWDDVWFNIEKTRKARARLIRLRRVAAAACLIGVVFLGFMALGVKSNRQPTAIANKAVAPASGEQYIVVRTAAEKEKLVLPDSSIVELSKGATISYSIPFKNKRDIQLTGDASFKVAKDKTKPFTVFAAGLATTALGTEFGITAIKGINKIRVKLFEGKVVVRSTNSNMKGWNKDVYLTAGQQLNYDLSNSILIVEKMKSADSKLFVQKQNTSKETKNIAERDLVFNGSSLPEVLKQLEKYFSTPISYNKKEIRQMHFTGTISNKDSLAIILKVIAQMNDLQIASSDTGFVVERIAATKVGEVQND
jgi:transmembrane sensor